MESCISDGLEGVKTGGARETVDGAYERIVKALFGSLEVLARELDDDKDRIMLHVLNIGTY